MHSATFDELCREGVLEIGDGYRAKNSELGGEGPIFLRSAYLQDHGFVREMPERFKVTRTAQFGSKASRLGDVVITTKGNSTGRLGVIREDQVGAIYSPHLSYWRSLDAEKLDQRFLGYWAQTQEFKSQLGGMAYSTDMAPYLSLRDQRRLRISFPEIRIQRATTELLEALDNKIELNRRMNETLEAMAQAIFRDWFVDFGPTRRKLSGAADPVAIMGGLVQDGERAQVLADLFPATLGDDGLPEGWILDSIYGAAKVIYGAPFASKQFNDEGRGRPLARIRDLPRHFGGVCTEELHPKEYLINPGDIVVGMDGEFRAYLWQGERTLMNQRICCFRPIDPGNRAFVYLGIQPSLATHETSAIGTTVIHLGKKEIDGFQIPFGGRTLLQEFGEIAEPLVTKIVANGQEIRTLAATRDLLLPKLMSGEIRLQDAEKLIEVGE